MRVRHAIHFLAIQAACLALVIPVARAAISVNIDLAKQRAFLLQDGQIVYDSPISSGRAGHRSPTGVFAILEKDLNHFSSLYGRIVDGDGDVVVRDADADMAVPEGCKFVPAPMKYFMRFDGATGMHAGILPGYPASHGCIRMPRDKAILFFNIVPVGAQVRVYGEPPEGRTPKYKGPFGTKPSGSPLPSPSPTPKPHGLFQFLFGPPSAAVTPAPAPPRPYPKVTPAPALSQRPYPKATPAPAPSQRPYPKMWTQ